MFKKKFIAFLAIFLCSANSSFSQNSDERLYVYKFDLNEADYTAKIYFEGKTFKTKSINFSDYDNISLIYKKQNTSAAGSFELSLLLESLFNKSSDTSNLPASLKVLKNKQLLLQATLIDYKDSYIENSNSQDLPYRNLEELFIKSLDKPGKNPSSMAKNPWDFEKNFQHGIQGKAPETEGGKMTVSLINNKTESVLNSEIEDLDKGEAVPFLTYNIKAKGSSKITIGFSEQLSGGKSAINKNFELILNLKKLGELEFLGSFN